ncbi:hypothetical protein GEMRC1_012817 [Eukaryota sp. GEM-RC1]
MKDIGDAISPIHSTVSLKKYNYDLWIFIFNPKPTSSLPPCYFFGEGLGPSLRKDIGLYRLPKRSFLGPTSMDAVFSFVMANLCRVTQNDVVFDPFMGTASTLIPVYHFKAIPFGSDLDSKVLLTHPKTHLGPLCYKNFDQYLLPHPDIYQADITFPFIRSNTLDAVLTDPPYGIRAGGRGKTRKNGNGTKNQRTGAYTNRLVDFECLDPLDLIRTMQKSCFPLLRTGKRLCYWLPQPDCITLEPPVEPGYQVVADCLQPCTSVFNRRLIVLEKLIDDV